MCVHLDGLNAEHKFRVWVTILGHKYHFKIQIQNDVLEQNEHYFWNQRPKMNKKQVLDFMMQGGVKNDKVLKKSLIHIQTTS